LCDSFGAPPALEVTGDLDYEESRDGRSGYDLGAKLIGCDDGIDERPREEGFFASLLPSFLRQGRISHARARLGLPVAHPERRSA
jgi:hypothetical protein